MHWYTNILTQGYQRELTLFCFERSPLLTNLKFINPQYESYNDPQKNMNSKIEVWNQPPDDDVAPLEYLPELEATPETNDKAPRPNNEHVDGFVSVGCGRWGRKIKKSYNLYKLSKEKVDYSHADGKSSQPKYTGTPTELYHWKGAATMQTISSKLIYYYKIRCSVDLYTSKTTGSPIGESFQTLYSYLKKDNSASLLVPIQEQSLKYRFKDGSLFNFIDQLAYIPTMDLIILGKYFLFVLEREQMIGVFVIHTSQPLWPVKEDPSGWEVCYKQEHNVICNRSWYPEETRWCPHSNETSPKRSRN